MVVTVSTYPQVRTSVVFLFFWVFFFLGGGGGGWSTVPDPWGAVVADPIDSVP